MFLEYSNLTKFCDFLTKFGWCLTKLNEFWRKLINFSDFCRFLGQFWRFDFGEILTIWFRRKFWWISKKKWILGIWRWLSICVQFDGCNIKSENLWGEGSKLRVLLKLNYMAERCIERFLEELYFSIFLTFMALHAHFWSKFKYLQHKIFETQRRRAKWLFVFRGPK